LHIKYYCDSYSQCAYCFHFCQVGYELIVSRITRKIMDEVSLKFMIVVYFVTVNNLLDFGEIWNPLLGTAMVVVVHFSVLGCVKCGSNKCIMLCYL